MTESQLQEMTDHDLLIRLSTQMESVLDELRVPITARCLIHGGMAEEVKQANSLAERLEGRMYLMLVAVLGALGTGIYSAIMIHLTRR